VELRVERDDQASEIDSTRPRTLGQTFGSQRSTVHANSELSSDPKRLVLCIDDDIRGLSLRKALLEAQGYTAVTASSGPVGIRLATELPVDVVVVDYEMPEMDGAAVVVEVRKCRPALPIIMLSGHHVSELPAFVLTQINKFIHKGLSPADFLSMLETVAVDALKTK
jgi:CheY-like chemotaxis protein